MLDVKKKKMKANGSPLKPKFCFSCGLKGHFVKDCPLKQKGQEEGDPLPVKLNRRGNVSLSQCFVCGTSGHKKKDCPYREDLKRQKAQSIARSENLIQLSNRAGEGKGTDLSTDKGFGEFPSPHAETEKLEGKGNGLPETEKLEGKRTNISETEKLEGKRTNLLEPKKLEGKRTDLPETEKLKGKRTSLLDTEKLEGKKTDLPTVNGVNGVPSPIEETEKLEDLEFKWGKKGGVGGKKKEIQFYRSFTYDNVEYNLYDCVYIHKEGEPEPYIGKLIKIWEPADKSKKVKIQWFFRPCEISHWLGKEKVLENEVFLASGEGTGLANINYLEAIAGKCNIICLSKDSRNPQPSQEEIKMADYVFYRTFDVSRCTISDQMDDNVGGLECKFIFNGKGSENERGVLKLNTHMKEDKKNAAVSHEPLQVSVQNQSDKSKTDKTDEKQRNLSVKIGADVKGSFVKQKSLSKDLKEGMNAGEDTQAFENRPSKKARVDKSMELVEDKNKNVVQDLPVRGNDKTKMVASASLKEKTISAQVKDKSTVDKSTTELVEEKNKKVVHDLPVRGNDEKKLVASASLNEKTISVQVNDRSAEVEGKNKNVVKKLPIRGNDERKLVTSASFKEKTISTQVKDSPAILKRVNSAVVAGEFRDKPLSKKARVDTSREEPKDTDRSGHNPSKAFDRNNSKEFGKPRILKDSTEANRLKPDAKITEISNGKLSKVSALEPADEDRDVEGRAFEITRRPEPDKNNWFFTLPWEERLQNAHEKGTLVLLQNLDPKYTSEEVEEIIWHAFEENCAAKMVQRTTSSSPHLGQAFIILNTRKATIKVINKLDEGCLMLTNGRPLVGCIGPPPCLARNQSTFCGHLVIDKLKLQNQREMREAVSTSHCSQPNTIEYEMAMEWCLLQSRSDTWWKKLFKQQGEELKKLKAKLKSK